MLDELQTWWQNTTPETRTALQNGGLVLAAFLGGHFLGAMVARALRARNFDAVLRLPGSSSPGAPGDHGFTPTWVAGLLVRLTVWAGAVWWMANKYGRAEFAHTLELIIKRTWALAAVLTVSLALGGLLARRLIDCLQGFSRSGAPVAPSRNGGTSSRWDAAGAVGAGAYALVALVALLITADMFDWPLTRTSALALWQFAQHLMVACAALMIGCLGAGWARDLATVEGAASPEKRAGQYTALGIVAATTVLAVAVLLSSAGLLIGLAALAVLGFLLWVVRGHLPDIVAGLQLRTQKVREVWFDGEAWQVTEVGLVTSQLGRRGEFCRMQNRVILEARLHGAPAEAPSAEGAANRLGGGNGFESSRHR
jgi:hypothetical protein